MYVEKIDLYKYFNIPKKDGFGGFLTATCHTEMTELPYTKTRPAMIVVPGGGYTFVSQREDEPVVMKFLSNGFNCFSLDYTVNGLGYPIQLIELAMAVSYVRENADKYSIDPNMVCAVGFSAGGHLVGTLSTHFDDEKVLNLLNKKPQDLRPNAIILAYAVLSMQDELSHGITKKVVTNNDESLYNYLDIIENVKKSSPPAFIWATTEDKLVEPLNSVYLAIKYQKLGIPYELHVYEKGWHGLSTATSEENYTQDKKPLELECKNWINMAIRWLKDKGITFRYN